MRSAEASLVLSPSFIRTAEMREAPAIFHDLTDGGNVTAQRGAARFPWTSRVFAAEAAVLAEALDLLPRSRSEATWSCAVVSIAAVMFEDICHEFHRARLKSVEQLAQPFSLVPLRGKYGWKNRACWAGLC